MPDPHDLAELCRDTARRLADIGAAEADPELAAKLRNLAAEFDRHAVRIGRAPPRRAAP